MYPSTGKSTVAFVGLALTSVALWIAVAVLCLTGWDAAGAIVATVGIAETVVGLALWWRSRRKVGPVVPPERATYISSHALLDICPITMEIPRPRVAAAGEYFPPGTAAEIYELAMRTATKRASRS